jgi:hypothetical protein
MPSVWRRLEQAEARIAVLEEAVAQLSKQPQEEPEKPVGSWQTHPCVVPNKSLRMSHINQVWECWCGRRWRLDNIQYVDRRAVNFTWTELMPSSPISESEIMKLLEGGEDAAT